MYNILHIMLKGGRDCEFYHRYESISDEHPCADFLHNTANMNSNTFLWMFCKYLYIYRKSWTAYTYAFEWKSMIFLLKWKSALLIVILQCLIWLGKNHVSLKCFNYISIGYKLTCIWEKPDNFWLFRVLVPMLPNENKL